MCENDSHVCFWVLARLSSRTSLLTNDLCCESPLFSQSSVVSHHSPHSPHSRDHLWVEAVMCEETVTDLWVTSLLTVTDLPSQERSFVRWVAANKRGHLWEWLARLFSICWACNCDPLICRACNCNLTSVGHATATSLDISFVWEVLTCHASAHMSRKSSHVTAHCEEFWEVFTTLCLI